MWKDLTFRERAELIGKWRKQHVLDYGGKIREYDESHRFDDGGDSNPMNYEYRGTVYDDDLKNQGITHLGVLPETVVTGKAPDRPYFSSYDPMALYRYGIEPALEGVGEVYDKALENVDDVVDAATSPAWWLNKAITGNSDNTVQGVRDWVHTAMRDAPMLLSPTRDIGTLRTGFEYAPWNPENPGIAGSDYTGQAVNNTFDFLLSSLGAQAASRIRPRARAVAYNNITPWSYKDVDLGTYHINKGMEMKDAIREFFTPGNVDTQYPRWRQRIDEHWALHPEEATEGGSVYKGDFIPRGAAVEFRDQAFAKALDQPYNPRLAENNVYLSNGDGTYSYNLDNVDKVRKQYGDIGFSGELAPHRKYSSGYEDNITTNGGGVAIEKLPEGLYRMTDTWDIAPLQHYLPLWIEKLPMSVQDILKTQRGQQLVDKVKNIDAIKVLGGDPFKLDFVWNPEDARFYE